MAYVAMNWALVLLFLLIIFLNGVCRHEHNKRCPTGYTPFLNGVCRHELQFFAGLAMSKFLNGVCRHELCDGN